MPNMVTAPTRLPAVSAECFDFSFRDVANRYHRQAVVGSYFRCHRDYHTMPDTIEVRINLAAEALKRAKQPCYINVPGLFPFHSPPSK